MGRLVQLWKAEETPTRVIYYYGPSVTQRGRLACTKTNGEVSLVEPVPGISEQDDVFLFRDLAALKLRRLATETNFPDETFVAT